MKELPADFFPQKTPIGPLSRIIIAIVGILFVGTSILLWSFL